MDDIDPRLALSAAIRAQGRRSSHPDDIRASMVMADRIIAYMRRAEVIIARREVLMDSRSCEPAAASAMEAV